jgi:hypothetical protein
MPDLTLVDDVEARHGMRYFCTTHQPLAWPLHPYMEPVATVPAGPGVTDLSERYPELAGRGRELGEYATLFGVRRLLQESWQEDGPPAPEEMVGTAHYRRFAVARPTGKHSLFFGVVDPETFAQLPEDLFVPPPGTLLLPAPIDYGMALLTNYGQTHPTRDLLHFMALAVDLGVVADRAVGRFLGHDHMITTPSAAVVPATWLVEVLESLERVVDAFESTVAVTREGYQRRAVGFCCERLHSLLVASLLDEWPEDRAVFNRALIVSADGEYRVGD